MTIKNKAIVGGNAKDGDDNEERKITIDEENNEGGGNIAKENR